MLINNNDNNNTDFSFSDVVPTLKQIFKDAID